MVRLETPRHVPVPGARRWVVAPRVVRIGLVIDGDDRGTVAGPPVEGGPVIIVPGAHVAQVVVLLYQALANHDGVRQAVGHAGHVDLRPNAVEHAAQIAAVEGVPMIRTYGVAPAELSTVAVLLVRVVTARTDGALRPKAAHVIEVRLIARKTIARAPQVGELPHGAAHARHERRSARRAGNR